MDFRNNRNTLLLAFILLMLGGVALLEESALVVMILLGLLFLVRQFDNNALAASSSYDSGADEYDYYDYYEGEQEREREWDEMNQRQTRQAQTEPVYRHALESVERAGLDPDEVQVLTVDIGTIAYRGDERELFRTWALPDDIDYLQPFVQLRLPTKATGRIKFEVYDGAGDLVYRQENLHNLERGRNLITPQTRLPIHDQRAIEGRWELRVSADNVLLSVHRFEFMEATNSAIRQHLGEDGEINTELRAAMAESRMNKMSLDDLLSYQEDEDDDARQQQAQGRL